MSARANEDDRRVHASHYEGEEIVRYERAGKWYIELVEPSQHAPARKHVGIGEAVTRALEIRLMGGTVHFGVPGGSAFDARVRARGVRS